MNMMVTELYDALISAGAEEGKARRAAEGLATSDQDFKKQFGDLREDNQKMRTEMSGLRGDLRQEQQELRAEMSVLRGELRLEMQGLRSEMSLIKWMMGVIVGLLAAILLRVFFV